MSLEDRLEWIARSHRIKPDRLRGALDAMLEEGLIVVPVQDPEPVGATIERLRPSGVAAMSRLAKAAGKGGPDDPAV